ncbi:hypothetical protein, partial [Rhizobium leguminosarum]|uniref:hypothetical protein n=1 Tax=Rhizobium leguminosarum TaxID=384 RepID=UPI003F94518C
DRLAETLDEKAMALAISLNESQARIEDTLETRSAALLNAVSGTHDRLSETLDGKAEAFATSRTEGQARIENTLETR